MLAVADLPLAEVAYRLPLTLRHVSQSSATLFFELNLPAEGQFVLQPTTQTESGFERALDPGQTRHLLTFEKLTPGTEYEAFVVLGNSREAYQQPNFQSRAWGPVRFSTPTDTGPLRFGVIGDASFGDPATIALIAAMADSELDFVLNLGDVVDETGPVSDPYESYAVKFYSPFEPLLTRMPIYTVPGNHDYDPDIRWNGSPFYDTAFPPFPDPLFPGQGDRSRNQYYAVAYQGVQFVFLDTQTFYGVPGREEQLVWLTERLVDPTFAATVPIFHVSPLSSSSVHPRDGRPVRSTWSPLFEAAGVPVVFSGHFHQYERLQAGGITYVVSGGGSSILYAPGALVPESQIFHRRTHFVLGELEAGLLRLTAIGLEGEILDQVEIPLYSE
jgi:predicted phosphodiesterase